MGSVDRRRVAPHHGAIMLISRLFTVLAAVLMLGAFGLLMLAPEDMTLRQGLLALDAQALGHLQGFVRHVLGARAWGRMIEPLLLRPVWLVPLSLGIVCAGVAVTLGGPHQSASSTRRRS